MARAGDGAAGVGDVARIDCMVSLMQTFEIDPCMLSRILVHGRTSYCEALAI